MAAYYRDFIELASDWSYEEIDNLRKCRKYYAQFDTKDAPRDTRKDALRYIKAATIIVDYLMGTSKTPFEVPDELYSYVQGAMLWRYCNEQWHIDHIAKLDQIRTS